MLLVKTKIGQSSIHGIGLFAGQFIRKGTKVTEYKKEFDTEIDKSKLKKLPPIARKTFLKYSYLSKARKKYILDFDDSRFCNHSITPNLKCFDNFEGSVLADVAIRDIKPGEELTMNYEDFDGDVKYKLKRVA